MGEVNLTDRWRQVEDLARSALELAPEERSSYLDSVCDEGSELRPKLDELVAAYETAQSGVTVLSRPSYKPPPAVELKPGQWLGPDKIVEWVGEGSMATVYRACRGDAPCRSVAVKVARHGFNVGCLTRQFQSERQILERLHHPSILRLMGGGTLEDSRPYMVVEFVEGLPVNEYCAQHRLPVAGRLDLFRQVLGAVHHIHEHGVIHRDIKPINILVAEGAPKLIDFGIAQRIDDPSESSSEALMTPQYASPEQVRGLRLSPLSDIYSLGVLLYELLTGRLPYEGNALGPREMAKLLDEQQPVPPSAVTESPEIRRQLAAGLEAIVLQALDQTPEHRHASAARFAEALAPYLNCRGRHQG